MPDDCGLNPPIETLPQIAQERAMRVLRAWSDGSLDTGESEGGGIIAHASRPPPSAEPLREDASQRGHRPTPAPAFARQPASPRRCRPDRDARFVRRDRVRRRSPSVVCRTTRPRAARDRTSPPDGIEDRARYHRGTRRPDRRGRPPGRFGDPLCRPAGPRPGGRPAHDPCRWASRAAPVVRCRRSPTALPVERIRPRDLADSGTDVA